MKNLLKIQIKTEWIVFLIVLAWGAIYSAYVYSLGLTAVYVDQNSHLNIARLVSDSLTPGISQLGFWPPLLHIFMAPFARIDALYTTGLAGAFTLVPLLALSSVFVYKLIVELTDLKILGIGGALMLALNPYALYYSSTPMTEGLFVFTLVGTAYFLVRFLKSMSFSSLVYLGIFVAISGLARYEGFLLLPIVLVFIAAKLFKERRKYHEVEAYSILFGLIALIGLGFTLIYGIAFGNGPLEFMNGDWAASAQQESFFLPTTGDLGLSIVYLIEASKLMLSPFLVFFSFFSFSILLLLVKKSDILLPILGISAVLLSPFVFDILALFNGTAILYLDNLPPYDGFFNERYGLYWIGFATIIPMLFIKLINDYFRTLSFLFKNSIAIIMVGFFVTTNVIFLHSEGFEKKYELVAYATETTLPADQIAAGKYLSKNYEGGNILITRAVQNFITPAAGIPLKEYIHESNFEIYDQALLAPWFYATWVVMYNDQIEGIEGWRSSRERISVMWRDSDAFHIAYELAFENRSERVYKLRKEQVEKVAALYQMNVNDIPSLNPESFDGDFTSFFWKLQDGIRTYQSSVSFVEQNSSERVVSNRNN